MSRWNHPFAQGFARVSTKTCPYCAEEIKAEAIRCRYCHAWLDRPAGAPDEPSSDGWFSLPRGKGGQTLRRPDNGRMVMGVCAAFGRYFGIDPTWIRVLYATATVFTFGVPGVVLYFLLALVIPSEDGQTIF